MPRHVKYILTILAVFLSPLCAAAQQTIINVPSSDVLPYGEIILKQSNKFRPFGEGKYVSLTPQLIMGTGKDTEISVEAGTNIEDTTSVKLNLTAKKVFRIKKAARFTVGATLSPSLTEGQKPDSMIYAHGSYLCKKTRTTFTAGGFVGGQREMPSLTGVMLGVDQTIIPNKLRGAVDWTSRDESWGVFGAGLKIRPEPTTSITTAILIPNSSQDRVAFSISISKYVGKVLPEFAKKEEQEQGENL